MDKLLVSYAKKVQNLGFHPIPIAAGTKNPPSWFSWTALRDGRRPALTEQDIESMFSKSEVDKVGLILNDKSILIDYDGTLGKYMLSNELIPRCSKELQSEVIDNTY